MFTVATGFAVGVQAITLNPLMPLLGAPVEGWLFLDSLLLAYAIPAALYGIIGYWRLGPHWLWRAALVLAAGFGFLWITLEVRHFFQGEHLNPGVTGETEWYAYSAAWLAFAAGGLAAALRWRKPWLRRASLIGLGLVIGNHAGELGPALADVARFGDERQLARRQGCDRACCRIRPVGANALGHEALRRTREVTAHTVRETEFPLGRARRSEARRGSEGLRDIGTHGRIAYMN